MIKIYMLAMAIPLAIFLAVPAGACTDGPVQITWEHRYAEDVVPAEVPLVNLAIGFDRLLRGDCDNFTYDILTFHGSHVNGQDNFTHSHDVAGVIKDGVQMLCCDPYPVPFVPFELDCFNIDTVIESSSSLSGYLIQAGTHTWPDVSIGTGDLQYCDEVIIDAPIGTIVEIPYSISAHAFAAEEAFATPDETFAIATVNLVGQVDGNVVISESMTVESVTVIPEEGSISASGVVPIVVTDLMPHEISINAHVELELQALAGGPWGLFVGTVTAGVSIGGAKDGSGFYVGNFTGAGGGPLPEGTHIYSAMSGIDYHGGGTSGIPVTDGIRRLNLYPNPTSGPVNVALSIPPGQSADVRLYDLRGRLIRNLAMDVAAGNGPLQWDGRDDQGYAMPSGIYYAVAKIGKESHTERVVIVR